MPLNRNDIGMRRIVNSLLSLFFLSDLSLVKLFEMSFSLIIYFFIHVYFIIKKALLMGLDASHPRLISLLPLV